MKNLCYFSPFLLFFFSFLGCRGQLTIIDRKQSDYRIIIPAGPQPDEAKAAGELQKYMEKVSGVLLPVFSDEREPAGHEIVIGNSRRLERFKIKAGFKEAESDGFVILTKEERLFITGGSAQGTLNGVYTFLEDYLGCRFYSPGVIFIPDLDRVVIPEIKGLSLAPFHQFPQAPAVKAAFANTSPKS